LKKPLQQIELVLLETVQLSGLDLDQIDAVVKTGGSSNIPAFFEMLNRIFGQKR
jgi:molecular chaperone DnaK (HSP70)